MESPPPLKKLELPLHKCLQHQPTLKNQGLPTRPFHSGKPPPHPSPGVRVGRVEGWCKRPNTFCVDLPNITFHLVPEERVCDLNSWVGRSGLARAPNDQMTPPPFWGFLLGRSAFYLLRSGRPGSAEMRGAVTVNRRSSRFTQPSTLAVGVPIS